MNVLSVTKNLLRQSGLIDRRDRKVGKPPGLLEDQASAPPASVSLIAYGPESVDERALDLSTEDLRALPGSAPVVWLDVTGTRDVGTLRRLGEAFEMHPLVLEDIASGGQRPKVEMWREDSVFFLRVPPETADVPDGQLAILVRPGLVITFHEQASWLLDAVRRRIHAGRGQLQKSGADYLGYAIIDTVVDQYFPVVEAIADRLEELELQLAERPRDSLAGRIHGLRHDVHSLRRLTTATREAVGDVLRSDHPAFDDSTYVFLRDTLDHLSSIHEYVESCRELAGSLMDLYLALMSHHMNEVMKVLTLFAAVFIPLSFIAGLYGMNFDTSSRYNMPELAWPYGYPFALGLMATTAFGLLGFFWKRGWIGAGRG